MKQKRRVSRSRNIEMPDRPSIHFLSWGGIAVVVLLSFLFLSELNVWLEQLCENLH